METPDRWIQTFTGKRVNPLNMRVTDIEIRDIAHALALTNRFTGHTPEPYSVAQHSIFVSMMCPDNHGLWGLLHDAPEAYMADISRPVKQGLYDRGIYTLKEIDDRIMYVICKKFGLSYPEPPCVKGEDDTALANEAYAFFGHTEEYKNWHHTFENGYRRYSFLIQPMTWQQAEREFLRRFELLTTGGKDGK